MNTVATLLFSYTADRLVISLGVNDYEGVNPSRKDYSVSQIVYPGGLYCS